MATRTINVIIDAEKCTGCGECIHDCPGDVIVLDDSNKAKPLKLEYCIQCCHCIAVCPTDAVTIPAYDTNNFPLLQPEKVSYEDLLAFLRRRRSVRRYSDKPVSKEIVEQLLEAARYAPSGTNRQGCKFVVAYGSEVVRRLSGVVVSYYGGLWDLMQNPFGRIYLRFIAGAKAYAGVKRYLPWFKEMRDRFDSGEDPIFFSTQLLIAIHADGSSYTTHDDCIIAMYHMISAAESIGLGSCINGILTSAARHSEDIRQAFGVPKGNKLYAATTFGWPAVKYRRAVDRFPPDVNWKER